MPTKYRTLAAQSILWLSLAAGAWGALGISHATISGENPCPSLAGIHICYIVAAGYLIMVGAQCLSARRRWIAFVPGWFAVSSIALVGTTFEIINGHTCPQSANGWPMCYVSLAICAAIALSFISVNRGARAATIT